MTTLQLVRQTRGVGHARGLKAVDNPHHKPPGAFRSGTETPLLLGSDELLLTAFRLRNDYRTVEIDFTDSYGQKIDGETAQHLQAQLTKTINQGKKQEFDQVLSYSMDEVFVSAVTLLDKLHRANGTVVIRRNGIIQVHLNYEMSSLENSLRAAFK